MQHWKSGGDPRPCKSAYIQRTIIGIEVVFEIRQINKLDNNAHVYPGQAFNVPVRPLNR